MLLLYVSELNIMFNTGLS